MHYISVNLPPKVGIDQKRKAPFLASTVQYWKATSNVFFFLLPFFFIFLWMSDDLLSIPDINSSWHFFHTHRMMDAETLLTYTCNTPLLKLSCRGSLDKQWPAAAMQKGKLIFTHHSSAFLFRADNECFHRSSKWKAHSTSSNNCTQWEEKAKDSKDFGSKSRLS